MELTNRSRLKIHLFQQDVCFWGNWLVKGRLQFYWQDRHFDGDTDPMSLRLHTIHRPLVWWIISDLCTAPAVGMSSTCSRSNTMRSHCSWLGPPQNPPVFWCQREANGGEQKRVYPSYAHECHEGLGCRQTQCLGRAWGIPVWTCPSLRSRPNSTAVGGKKETEAHSTSTSPPEANDFKQTRTQTLGVGFSCEWTLCESLQLLFLLLRVSVTVQKFISLMLSSEWFLQEMG